MGGKKKLGKKCVYFTDRANSDQSFHFFFPKSEKRKKQIVPRNIMLSVFRPFLRWKDKEHVISMIRA